MKKIIQLIIVFTFLALISNAQIVPKTNIVSTNTTVLNVTKSGQNFTLTPSGGGNDSLQTVINNGNRVDGTIVKSLNNLNVIEISNNLVQSFVSDGVNSSSLQLYDNGYVYLTANDIVTLQMDKTDTSLVCNANRFLFNGKKVEMQPDYIFLDSVSSFANTIALITRTLTPLTRYEISGMLTAQTSNTTVAGNANYRVNLDSLTNVAIFFEGSTTGNTAFSQVLIGNGISTEALSFCSNATARQTVTINGYFTTNSTGIFILRFRSSTGRKRINSQGSYIKIRQL